MTDFLEIYASSRCVAEHHDAYQTDELTACYRANIGELLADSGVSHIKREAVLTCNNFPTTLFLVIPLAALPWKFAAPVWMALIAGCFIAACFCLWSFGAGSEPRIYGALIFLIMVNSGQLLSTGNTAGLVVSLAVIATCCFLQERFVPAGIVCLAVALVMKPHDAGPIWLYFLLAGGIHRKRAIQTLALTIAILLAAVLWVSHAAPHWFLELQSNPAASFSSGGVNDPGPSTGGGFGVVKVINLQAALSFIRNDARFYNPVAYVVCGALLLAWCVKTLRSGFSRKRSRFALAAISALAMLPTYHRTYDARLLLLTVPACALLWRQRGPIAWWALLLSVAGIIITGDLFWVVLFQFTRYSRPSITWAMIPTPLVLLAVGGFYLWIYLRGVPMSAAAAGESPDTPARKVIAGFVKP
jgi:hypothetical protein